MIIGIGDNKMVESIRKNQEATRIIIKNFVSNSNRFPVTKVQLEEKLVDFIKYFARNIMGRVQEDDCYFVDMLEDIERLNND